MKMPSRIAVVLIVAVFASMIFVAYAIQSILFYQSLMVPGLEVYQSDGSTPISNLSDQTAIWSWNETSKSFYTTVQVKNVGSNDIDVSIGFDGLNAGWVASYSGSLTAIAPGESRSISLYVTNDLAVSGDETGNFSVNVRII